MLFAGLDTHKESVLAHVIDEKGRVVREERFSADDLELARLSRTLRNAECVMEAGTTCYQFYDTLTEQGIKVKVAHPLLLRSYCGLKKTDKIDAKKLAVMLKAGFIPEAHIPSKKVRMERDLVRQHIHLTQSRTAEISRTKALLLRHRIKPNAKNIFGKRANWLENACIPDNVRFLLQQSINQIQSLEEQKKEVDKKITENAKTNKDAAILHTIPSIGWFTAYLTVVTIDGIERFPSAEQLVSYAGLAPRIYQSGDTRYTGRISKQGRPELRWALIQCAWIAARKSKRFRKTYLRIKRRSGQKKAIVAVARKLLTTMYYLLKKQEAYKENA